MANEWWQGFAGEAQKLGFDFLRSHIAPQRIASPAPPPPTPAAVVAQSAPATNPMPWLIARVALVVGALIIIKALK